MLETLDPVENSDKFQVIYIDRNKQNNDIM